MITFNILANQTVFSYFYIISSPDKACAHVFYALRIIVYVKTADSCAHLLAKSKDCACIYAIKKTVCVHYIMQTHVCLQSAPLQIVNQPFN